MRDGKPKILLLWSKLGSLFLINEAKGKGGVKKKKPSVQLLPLFQDFWTRIIFLMLHITLVIYPGVLINNISFSWHYIHTF